MNRKFLAPALVLILCIGITMTAYASPQTDHLQNQPQFTTNATSEELSIIKTLFSAEEYAELYPDAYLYTAPSTIIAVLAIPHFTIKLLFL